MIKPFCLDIAKGWQFVNDITRSNKLRIWFAPGGRIEKEEFGIDRKVSVGVSWTTAFGLCQKSLVMISLSDADDRVDYALQIVTAFRNWTGGPQNQFKRTDKESPTQ